MQARVLVIGVGNPLRGDDGIGAAITAGLASLSFPGLCTLEVQQLQTELLESFIGYTHVVIADAQVEGPLFRFYPVTEATVSPPASSHHTSPVLLGQLYRQLYGGRLSLWICSVRADSFEMGAALSHAAREGVRQAVEKLTAWLQAGCPDSWT